MPSGALHEDLRREDETSGPSDRKFGLTIGAVSSAGGAGYEDCMAGKGYVQAGTGTQDLSEPVAVARHPIEMVPESFDDPAR